MSAHERNRRGLALSLALCICSVAATAGENATPSADGNATAVNPLAKRALKDLSMTIERPLFAPSRHRLLPDAAPVAHVEAPPPPPATTPSVILVGIVTDSDGPQAVLHSGGAAKDLRVRVGDDVSGWKVTEIADQHLTLALDDRILSFALFAQKQPNSAEPDAGAMPKRRGLLGHADP